ncbi:probable inactive histone-lysine N-methyltransferase SUVR1 [Papaver somniferum]|uniref:probable inactive histone-lysine N-methyltransferase SUVR1 n=1 Tax=Papaver somniferum TaxID=3469 RepID=UPI000E6F7AD7|nr:probable inactive histone-lysine N-methyltransferase SUVR1 [Papaver somniferum]
MAPKKKLSRYDAAYDHLGRGGLGFTKKVIRKKIDSLLKVYGDQGWVFIEDGAYKLLIDCLLEEQENLLLKGKEVEEEEEDREILLLKDKQDQHELFSKEKDDEEEEDQESEEQPPPKISSLAEIERRLTETSRFSSVGETSKVKSRITENGRFASVSEESDAIETPESTEVEISEPTRTGIPQRITRRPCFGFYVSDDDDEDDCEENYVLFETKASLRERIARERSVAPRRERKSRWDMVGV